MSSQTPQPAADAQTAPAASGVAPTASYTLVSSYSTVQVLSPTSIVDVVYCTINTSPSNVTASTVVPQSAFDAGSSGTLLATFAQAIETVMQYPHVTHGVGSQVVGASGLLTDTVVFTVTYTDPVKAPNGATATATVPNSLLDFTDPATGSQNKTDVNALLDSTYSNLQAAAGG